MNYIYLLIVGIYCIAVYTLSLGDATKCDCTELNNQFDCNYANCLWNNSFCQQYTCPTIKNITMCKLAINCAFFNGSCKNFTKCSDYVAVTDDDCSYFGSGCTLGDQYNATFSYCKSVPTPVYNCSSYSMETCEIDSQGACQFDEGCRGSKCSDMTIQNKCSFIFSSNTSNPILCSWDYISRLCSEATDINTLTSKNCFKNTAGTYAWNSLSSSCLACRGSQQSVVFGVILKLMIIIIL